MSLARVLGASLWLLPTLASAQRIIHLDETSCGFGWEAPQPVWVVAASACPAATLAVRRSAIVVVRPTFW